MQNKLLQTPELVKERMITRFKSAFKGLENLKSNPVLVKSAAFEEKPAAPVAWLWIYDRCFAFYYNGSTFSLLTGLPEKIELAALKTAFTVKRGGEDVKFSVQYMTYDRYELGFTPDNVMLQPCTDTVLTVKTKNRANMQHFLCEPCLCAAIKKDECDDIGTFKNQITAYRALTKLKNAKFKAKLCIEYPSRDDNAFAPDFQHFPQKVYVKTPHINPDFKLPDLKSTDDIETFLKAFSGSKEQKLGLLEKILFFHQANKDLILPVEVFLVAINVEECVSPIFKIIL